MILSSTGIMSNNGKVFFAIIEPVLSISELFKLGSISVRKVRHWISLDSFTAYSILLSVLSVILPSPKPRQLRAYSWDPVKWRIWIESLWKASVEGGDEFVVYGVIYLTMWVFRLKFYNQPRRTDLLTQWPLGDCALFLLLCSILAFHCVSLINVLRSNTSFPI